MKVWLEDWEWQCCGGLFAVGETVEWGLIPLESASASRRFLAEPLGEDLVNTLTHYETHHADVSHEAQPVPTRGRIESIRAVYWHRAPRSVEDPRTLYPVAETAVLEPREKGDGWEPEIDGGPMFAGYIVELSRID